jgi:hypothetical protein
VETSGHFLERGHEPAGGVLGGFGVGDPQRFEEPYRVVLGV